MNLYNQVLRFDRFITKKDTAAILNQLLKLMPQSIAITDHENNLLLGVCCEEVTQRLPVQFADEVLGWVNGKGEEVLVIAKLLNHLVIKEVEKKQLVTETLSLYKEVNLLYSISEKITAHLDIVKVASLIIEEANKAIKSTHASVLLFNEETQQLERIAAIGENIQTNVVFKPNEGIAGSVFTSGKAEIINHVSLDSRFIPKHVQIGSMLCAPIKTIERTIGVICLSHHEPIDYTAADLKLFSVLVSQASSAIENAILHERTVREEKIKSHLERYVSAQVVNAIMGGAGQEGVTLNSEKRNISILFSDIRGFTRLCETMEPEEIVEHLNTYFESMVDVIFAHQGTVNKFVGDMIVALFGAPARLQNSETYAVAAAIDMQKWLQAGAKTWVGKNFNTGIGLNSGNVVVGNVGSPKHMDYTAIGDEVNLASRLQSIAKGGQILVSQSVYNATKEEFSYQHHGCIQVKGKEKPVDVYEVIY